MKRSIDRIYDRLYHQMVFPSVIMDLIDCPGLLRLRDVRMANNQFYAFPAFANSSRYEHSLGVCYLAGICAEKLGLPERDKLELMMAGLYHDVGTPPFAHATEEVLMAQFGFDHELNLKKLIIGDSGDFDQDYAQVYLGKSLKLKSICQTKRARSIGIDPHRIARIIVGDKTDPLAPLINGTGMDLDNIDNICRAVSAMGIMEGEVDFANLAIELASSFIIENGKVFYDRKKARIVKQWLLMRDVQYSEIYRSIDDFSYQAMIKKAIRLMSTSKEWADLGKHIWKLTDSEFTYQHLLKDPRSKLLMERVLLCKPYTPLVLVYVRGKGCIQYINTNIRTIEENVSSYLSRELGLDRYSKEDLVLANFYPDKRHRWISEDRWIGEGAKLQCKKREEGAILGFFTPAKVSGYVSDAGGKSRSIRRFESRNIQGLVEEVQKLLCGFEVMKYGEEI